MCQERFETVCDEVPTTTCTLVPYAECDMYMEEAIFNETEVISGAEYVPWECSNFTQEEIHTKLVRGKETEFRYNLH